MTNFIKNILNANEKVNELNLALEDQKKANADLNKLMNDYKASIEDFVGIKTKWEDEVKVLKDNHAKEITTLKADYDKQLTSMKDIIKVNDENHKAENAKMTEDYNKKISELEDKYLKAEKSAKRKASEIVEGLGLSANAIPPVKSTVLTNDDIVAKFNSLTGTEKSEFYKAHKDAIWKALSVKK